jgi:hypothetical protein
MIAARWPAGEHREAGEAWPVEEGGDEREAERVGPGVGGLLRCGFAGRGLLLVDAIVRNPGGRDHLLPRCVHNGVPGGEVRRNLILRG